MLLLVYRSVPFLLAVSISQNRQVSTYWLVHVSPTCKIFYSFGYHYLVMQMVPNLHLKGSVLRGVKKSVCLYVLEYVIVQRFHNQLTTWVCSFYSLICIVVLVRSPYLATSTPYPSSKKKHHRLVNGTTGGLHHELDDTRNQMAVNSTAKQRWAKAVTATGENQL